MLIPSHGLDIDLATFKEPSLDAASPSLRLVWHRVDIHAFKGTQRSIEVEFLNFQPNLMNVIGMQRYPIWDRPEEGERNDPALSRDRITGGRYGEDCVCDEQIFLPMQEQRAWEMTTGKNSVETTGLTTKWDGCVSLFEEAKLGSWGICSFEPFFVRRTHVYGTIKSARPFRPSAVIMGMRDNDRF